MGDSENILNNLYTGAAKLPFTIQYIGETMTASIANTLDTRTSGHVVRLIVGFALGLFFATIMFWTLQKLIQASELESIPVKAESNLSIPNVQTNSAYGRYILPEVNAAQPQPAIQGTILPDAPYPPKGQIDIQHPEFGPGDNVTGGFSLGVGKGDYLPIIKVIRVGPSRNDMLRWRTPSERIDGNCTIQNPVPRMGKARDSTIMKGQCPTRLGGGASNQDHHG